VASTIRCHPHEGAENEADGNDADDQEGFGPPAEGIDGRGGEWTTDRVNEPVAHRSHQGDCGPGHEAGETAEELSDGNGEPGGHSTGQTPPPARNRRDIGRRCAVGLR
jgi:hypothetical protein